MSTWSRSARLSIALALVAVAPAKAQFIDWDFDSDDGFWTTETVVGSEAWSWSPGAWSVGSSTVPGLVRLISPEVTAGFVLGGVLVDHRYNFEAGCFDGGAASYRVNGGAWTPLDFFSNGYDNEIADGFGNPLAGRDAWCGSSGFKWSAAGGFVNPGDKYQIRFEASWDSSIENAAPNWEINRVQAFGFQEDPTVVPEPSTVALLATGLVGMGVAAIRRRRKSD